MRTLLGLPYNAHTYLLGPIMGQLDLRSQLYIRNFRFLWHGFRSDNNIIYTCMHYVIRIVVWDISWHFIDTGITSRCLMIFKLCIARISQCELSDHQLAIVNNLSLLISVHVREGDLLLLVFTSYEIAELINELAIM